jgi:TRAP transporter TAXI family solute receptor
MMRRFRAWNGLLLVPMSMCLACETKSATVGSMVVRVTPSTAVRLQTAFRALPDITPQIVEVGGSLPAVRALQAKEADLAIVMADVAYQAHIGQSGAKPAPTEQIRGVAVLNVNTVYLAAARHTSIDSIEDLRDRRVGMGPSTTAATAIAELLVESSGVGLHRIRSERLPNQETLKQLSNGGLDAAFLSLNASVQAAVTEGARLIEISGPWVERLRQRYLFLQTVLVPAGTYPRQTEPLHTVGVDLLLVCRADLDQRVVYRLSKAYFDELQKSAPATDLERAPATPIPLHPGAAHYYRERALSR